MNRLFRKLFTWITTALQPAREPRSASEHHVWLLNTPGWRAMQEINR
ncbi:hypothetical protein [Allomeiothermus silvanus]|nr:hypothetical protein [Allomeiothermus silvanus]